MDDAARVHVGGIDDDQAVVEGAQPDKMRGGFDDGVDALDLQIARGDVAGHQGVRLSVAGIDVEGAVAFGGDPQAASAVLIDLADRGRMAVLGRQGENLGVVAVGPAIDQALGGADPQLAGAVAQYGADLRRGQAGIHAFLDPAGVAVIVVQAAAGADP